MGIYGQRHSFNQWMFAITPFLELIRKISWIFFEFEVHKKCKKSNAYDIDESEEKDVCFTRMYKRFLIHSLKNGTLKFKNIMKRLVLKEPWILYLYEEEFMENVFFKNVHLSHRNKLKWRRNCKVVILV